VSSGLSQFASRPKFKDERKMPFTKSLPPDSSELCDLAYGWGKIVTKRAFGESGPGLGLDFDSIEQLAVETAQALARGTVEEILQAQFRLLGAEQPCPQCSRLCAVQKGPRTLSIRGGGAISYDEPVCHCPACRRDFFPFTPDSTAGLARLLPDGPG
jgi:hypothetical protein